MNSETATPSLSCGYGDPVGGLVLPGYYSSFSQPEQQSAAATNLNTTALPIDTSGFPDQHRPTDVFGDKYTNTRIYEHPALTSYLTNTTNWPDFGSGEAQNTLEDQDHLQHSHPDGSRNTSASKTYYSP